LCPRERYYYIKAVVGESHEASMNAYVLLLVTYLAFTHAQQQIAVNVNINNKDTPVLANQLSAELTRANLQQVTITQSINEEILVDICTPGTYSYAGASACTNCPSGTSSPIEGATNAMVCHSCSAGTWALGGSPTCTNCQPIHFRPRSWHQTTPPALTVRHTRHHHRDRRKSNPVCVTTGFLCLTTS